jgi:hypothetical protein
LIPAWVVTSANSTGANFSGSGGSVEAAGDGEVSGVACSATTGVESFAGCCGCDRLQATLIIAAMSNANGKRRMIFMRDNSFDGYF